MKRTWLLLSVVTFGLGFAHIRAVKPQLQRFHFEQRCMGTLFQITLFSENETIARQISDSGFRKAHELDAKFSDYKFDSELMQLCGKAGQGPVVVSNELFDILSQAQEISRRSGGAFDVTVGPIVRLWRLARRTRELPSENELKEALAKTGYQKLRLEATGKTVELTLPGMKLDLGGIAKGYAAEVMLEVIRQQGCKIALIAAGGDIVAGDAPPDTDGWRVAIAAVGSQPQPVLRLKNAAVSTSGDAEQFVEIGGRRYAHIVDPKTGLGLTNQFAVTVIAKTGTTADALATAVAVLGPEKGLKLIESEPGAAVRIVQKRGDGWEVHESPRFKSWIHP